MTRKVRKVEVERDARGNVLWPWPDGVDYYRSGTNARGEIQAMLELGLKFGCAADVISWATLEWLARYVEAAGGPNAAFGGWGGFFVDSGAFGEVDLKHGPPSWPHPMTAEDWANIWKKYFLIREACGHRAVFVLPDKVAHQDDTLKRLERYGEQVAELLQPTKHGAPEGILAVQQGRIPAFEFWQMAVEVMKKAGVPLGQVRPGFPMKKDTTPLHAIEAFLANLWSQADHRRRARTSSSLHLLGRGLFAEEILPVIRAVSEVYEDVWAVHGDGYDAPAISCDSVWIKSVLGNRNAPGALMGAQDLARKLGVGDSTEAKRISTSLAALIELDAQQLDAEDAPEAERLTPEERARRRQESKR